MGIVAPDPNLATEAQAVAADVAEVGSIVKSKPTRGKIYAAMALFALGLTVANGVVAYLGGPAHLALGPVPVVLGAIDVAYPIVSGAVHGLSKANT